MIYATCINRLRDKNNRIYQYILRTEDNEIKKATPEELKTAIKHNYIVIDNLHLTTDNRLVNNTKIEKLSSSVTYIHPENIARINCEKPLSFKINKDIDKIIKKARLLYDDIATYQLRDNLIALETPKEIIVVTNLKSIAPVTCTKLFLNTKFSSIDMTNVNTLEIYDMSRMFDSTKATTINVSTMNTKNVVNMSNMFSNTKVKKLDLSNFDTSHVSDMSEMFTASDVKELNLDSFNTRNVTTMKHMFSELRINVLKLDYFDTINVKDMLDMFGGIRTNVLDLSNFSFNSVERMGGIFSAVQINTLKLGNFNLSKVKESFRLFSNSHIHELIVEKVKMPNYALYTDLNRYLPQSIDNWENIKNKFKYF